MGLWLLGAGALTSAWVAADFWLDQRAEKKWAKSEWRRMADAIERGRGDFR